MRHSLLVVAGFFFVLTGPVQAWNNFGHMEVAEAAHLREKALESVRHDINCFGLVSAGRFNNREDKFALLWLNRIYALSIIYGSSVSISIVCFLFLERLHFPLACGVVSEAARAR
jgi:hypothetical protein